MQPRPSQSAMSSVTSVPSDALQEIPDDPMEIFGAVIERNDAVCKHCYRRLGCVRPYPFEQGFEHHAILGFVDEDLPPDRDWEYLDREYHEQVRDRDRYEGAFVPADELDKSNACWSCGEIDHHRTPPTRSRGEAIRAAAGASVTLLEYGVAHDWVLLLARVGELKREPDYAGDDFGTFRQALAEAVRVVR